MKEQVIAAGFSYYAKCRCGGIYTEKYQKDKWKIYIMPYKHQFRVLENGKLKGTFNAYTLETKLRDYAITA